MLKTRFNISVKFQRGAKRASVLCLSTLLEERCAGCHTLDRVVQAQKSGEEWEQTVDRMIGREASLNESERAVLIEYLAATHRP